MLRDTYIAKYLHLAVEAVLSILNCVKRHTAKYKVDPAVEAVLSALNCVKRHTAKYEVHPAVEAVLSA